MDALNPIKVLISLHRGYGLGDSVLVSAVLRHVAKYRPHWTVDYQAEEGRHCVGRGIVANTFAYGSPYPTSHYDAEVQITLFDRWYGWSDHPNTRVSSCLHECFGLGWDADCGRYRIDVSPQATEATSVLVQPGSAISSRRAGRKTGRVSGKCNGMVVAVHYQGDSAQSKKNLTHEQAIVVCKIIEKLGGTPLLIDWRDTSPLPDSHTVRTTGRIPASREWGADAEMNCAVISQCAAFVGIDSGPAKCASATDTPSLVVWTGHHPAPFHDPAPNTTHLVPHGYHDLEPVCGDRGVIAFFDRWYNVRTYDCDPVGEVGVWLKEVLK